MNEKEQENIQDIIKGFMLGAEANGQSWDWIGNRLASVLRQYDVVSGTLTELTAYTTEASK